MKQNYSETRKKGKMVKAKRKQERNTSKANLINDCILSIIISTSANTKGTLCVVLVNLFFFSIFDHMPLKVNKRKHAFRYNFE